MCGRIALNSSRWVHIRGEWCDWIYCSGRIVFQWLSLTDISKKEVSIFSGDGVFFLKLNERLILR